MIGAAFILGIGTTPVQAAKKVDTPKSIAALVDINSATQKELEGVKGVGAATAKKIIANRPYKSVDELSKAGLKAKTIIDGRPYNSIEDVMRVKGIKGKTFDAIKDYIVVK